MHKELKSISRLNGKMAASNGRVTVGDGGEGVFTFVSQDLSSLVSLDNFEGVFVAPDVDPTGASGAWVRQFSGPANVAWFGMSPESEDCSGVFSAAINAFNHIIIPHNTYTFIKPLSVSIKKDMVIDGVGFPLFNYLGNGDFITIGDDDYITNLSAGYFRVRLGNINIDARSNPLAGVLFKINGVRNVQMSNVKSRGGESAVVATGIWDSTTIKNCRFQDTTSDVIHIKERSNNVAIENTAVLSGGRNGIRFSTENYEIVDIALKNVDFEGCNGALEITGMTELVSVSNCWFENNAIFNIKVRNKNHEKRNIVIRDCFISSDGTVSPKIGIHIGDTVGGKNISGKISGCQLVNSPIYVDTDNVANFDIAEDNKIRGWSVISHAVPAIIPSLPTGQNPSVGSLDGLISIAKTNAIYATAVLSFENGRAGKSVTLFGADNGLTILKHGPNMMLNGGSDFTIINDATITLVCLDGYRWVEQSRSVQQQD